MSKDQISKIIEHLEDIKNKDVAYLRNECFNHLVDRSTMSMIVKRIDLVISDLKNLKV